MNLAYRVGIPLLVSVLTLLLMLVTVAAYDRLWKAERHNRLHDRAVAVGSSIERHLQRNLSAATVLGTLVRQHNGQLANFETEAAELLDIFTGVTNLQLAPAGIIEQIYPLEGHEAALGHNILRDDKSRNEAWVAINSHTLTLSGPFTLVQGGNGMIVRQPVYLPQPNGSEQFWGFASALIMLDGFIASTALDRLEAEGFDYRLIRTHPTTGIASPFAGVTKLPLPEPVEIAVQLPNQVWQLQLAWRAPPLLAPYTLIQILVSLVMATLAGVICYIKMVQPLELQRLVRQKTRQSAALQRALTHERDRARDYLNNLSQTLLLVTDLEGRIVLLNRFGYQLMGYPEGSLVGSSWVHKCLPTELTKRANAFFFKTAGQALGYQAQGETAIRLADQQQRLIRWNCTVVRSDGHQHHLLFIGQDVTTQRADENRLRQLSRAVEQSTTCVVMLHRDGHIEYVNPSFSQLTGFSALEVIGRKPHFLECDRTDQQTLINLRRQVARGLVWSGEICYRRKNGAHFWARENISPITNEQGEITHFVSVLEDISNQHAHQQEVERLAYYDQLTGIGNRRLFRQQLDQRLREPQHTPVALLHIDLDHFKRVNELLGHDAGDQLLVRVAEKLRREISSQSLVARISGDEFLIALSNTESDAAGDIAKRLLRELRQPTWLGSDHVRSHEMLISASIGIAVDQDHDLCTSDLLHRADLAMNQAKKRGGNSYRLFRSAMIDEIQANLQLEQELHRAIREREFELHFQPQINLLSGKVCGLEALVRWRHPSRGLIFPDRFIPLAEEAGLIVAIGQQVIRLACETWSRLEQQQLGHLSIAVNLSALQFRDPLFISTFRQLLQETRTPAERIELELTESMLMTNINEAIELLKQLRAMGCRLAIDDFGTGYSSLNYLKQLPVNVLKVDRSFVKDIPDDRNDMAITAAIIAMAQELELAVVAEGVETDEQRRFLCEGGCQLAQGYLYSPPVPEPDLARVIAGIDANAQPQTADQPHRDQRRRTVAARSRLD